MSAPMDGPAPMDGRPPEGVRFRRPTEADYELLVGLLDEWWGGRRVQVLLPRLWLRHFAGTCWIAEEDAGGESGTDAGLGAARLVGFLVGFLSPDRPAEAVCHLVGVDPNRRRRGIGSALYARFAEDAQAAGRSLIVASVWPGDRAAVDFHRALGFAPDAGPGTRPLYGLPARPAHEFGREDAALMTLVLG